MTPKYLCALMLLVWPLALLAEPVSFSGYIGPYEVEVELSPLVEDRVEGRYRYVGRDAWLSLSGVAYGTQVMQLDEWADDTQTGRFFLEVLDGDLQGIWQGGEAEHPVRFVSKTSVLDAFPMNPREDVGAGLTGRYEIHHYWLNDHFAPHFEVGFNGGTVNVIQLAENEIFVSFEFAVGPTYHIASFQGRAQRQRENLFVHDQILPGGNTPCRLEFFFQYNELNITDQGNGYACQFGARAHANFDLPKVSDTAEFSSSW